MAITIQINPIDNRILLPLMIQAGEEVGLDYPVDTDFETYDALIAQGDYVVAVAFDGDKPVGYIGVLFSPSLFNRRVANAIVDSFFVLKSYRRGTAAGRLISAVEPFVRSRTNRLAFQCKDGNPLSLVLAKRGFKPVDRFWEKVWD